MKLSIHKFGLAAFVVGIAAALPAQTSTQIGNDAERGLTEVESVQSTINSQERLFKVDSNVGWEFSQHFSVYGGVPLYFVNVPSSTTTVGGTTTTTPGTSHNGLGNVYLGFLLKGSSPQLDYAGVLTMAAPTASTKDGLSTGRATIDLDNRIQHAFGPFTPFFDAGIGNSVPDSMLFSRPFTSLGFITHLEEGAGFKLTSRFSVNGSAYQIIPAGNQKVYSKLVGRGQSGNGSGKNVFQMSAVASGSGLTRENGFNAWVQFEPVPAMDLAVGYTRSETFGLNSLAFNLRMNFGKLLRPKRTS
jgi:hypothetical protein